MPDVVQDSKVEGDAKFAAQKAGTQEGTSAGTDQAKQVERLRGILKDTRSKHFSGKIPDDHPLDVVIDPDMPMDHGVMHVAPDGKTIYVHPDAVYLSDESLGWVFGHELGHVNDILTFGIKPGTTEHWQSEIDAYNWQLKHAKDFGINLSFDDVMEIQDLISDYQNRIRMDEIMQQMMNR